MNKLRCLIAGYMIAACAVSTPNTVHGDYIVLSVYRGGDSFVSQLFAQDYTYAVSVDGAGDIKVPKVLKNGLLDEMDWSPDGQWIVYSTSSENARAGGNSEIYLMRSDGSGKPVRVTDRPYNDINPAWSPNGTTIAYVYDGIYVLNVECVLHSKKCNLQPTLLVKGGAEPDWSPDGKRIVYDTLYAPESEVFVLDTDGTGEPVKISPDGHSCITPQWSLGGGQIAFVCGDGIYIVNADGSSLQRLVEAGWNPKWSPDGSQLALIGDEMLDSDLGQPVGEGGFVVSAPRSIALFLINADGSNLRRLTTNNYESIGQFTWLPSSILKTKP